MVQEQAQSGDKTAVLQRRTASHRWRLVPLYSGTKHADWETSLLCSSGLLDQTQEIVHSIHNHSQLIRSLWSKNNYSWVPVTSLVLCSFIRSTLLPCFISACSGRPRSATPHTPPWPGSSAGSRPFGPSSLSIFTEISASGWPKPQHSAVFRQGSPPLLLVSPPFHLISVKWPVTCWHNCFKQALRKHWKQPSGKYEGDSNNVIKRTMKSNKQAASVLWGCLLSLTVLQCKYHDHKRGRFSEH